MRELHNPQGRTVCTAQFKLLNLSAEVDTVPTEGNLDSEVWQRCALRIAVYRHKIYRTVVCIVVEFDLSHVRKDVV